MSTFELLEGRITAAATRRNPVGRKERHLGGWIIWEKGENYMAVTPDGRLRVVAGSHVDYPVICRDGVIRFDFPERVPKYMRDEVVRLYSDPLYARSKLRFAGVPIEKLRDRGPRPRRNPRRAKSSEFAPDTMTLEEHAEAWWREKGRKVPRRGSKAWDDMYKKWHSFAFRGFGTRRR